MSCVEDEYISIRKDGKKACFLTLFRTIFGCIFKKKTLPEKNFMSVAIQCHLGSELSTTASVGEGTFFLESNTQFDVTLVDQDFYPKAEEFRSSLNKLDNLINTLKEIQGLYKNQILNYNGMPRQCLFTENETSKESAVSKILNKEEEVLQFNINFDKNTCIQCHTNRSKHSLKIIENACQKNYNTSILHRCDSEILIKNSQPGIYRSKIATRKFFSDTNSQEITQLQRNFFTLPGFNLTLFKTNLVRHMKSMKKDVQTLRSILYSIQCLVGKGEISPFYLEPIIGQWFSDRDPEIMYSACDDNFGRDFVELEANRYEEAKIRATNFCKFYRLTKICKPKSKSKKYRNS